ncbi:MAG: 1-deoxy-D-xylulose-5-phosphate synthase [Victivallales bacterium]|nr:1-deoxy-D-xylulose-5-phosphate synthase [Victivallales bacterium]
MEERKDSVKSVLEKVASPADLKGLSPKDRLALADEIRNVLMQVISANGGHLAPNMGVVELTIALHTVFDALRDKLIWDVGHQAYVHKLLTGRREFFKTLRQDNGCLGFPSRDESEYDVFGAGHAGTAISAALGFAAERDSRDGNEKIVAVVGDGSLNCGISLEGLNNVAEVTDDMIIVLNDNKMSISPNVGSMARYLNRIISTRGYNRFKASIRKIVRMIPMVGDEITHKISRLEEAAKSMFVHGVIFEELGIRYIGPVNGHDMEEMIRTFEVISEFPRPVVVHVVTEKGRGYGHAEAAPEKFHGLSSFDLSTGDCNSKPSVPTFSEAFGISLCALAEKHGDVVGITAAMCAGTGMAAFAEKFPRRFYDVGIAEGHAVVFAAGLAAAGKRPVVAIYSTFLQRALDCVMHDICLQDLPVIICTDRSGIVDDGPTHHGIHDLAFLKDLPNIAILSPKDGCELRDMLFASYSRARPVVIRYPRALAGSEKRDAEKLHWGTAEVIQNGHDLALWAVGAEVATAKDILKKLAKNKIRGTLVNTRFIKPFDSRLLLEHASKMPLATIEDCQTSGGVAAIVDSLLVNQKHHGVKHYGWPDSIVPHGTICGIREKFGLDAESMAKDIEAWIKAVKKK